MASSPIQKRSFASFFDVDTDPGTDPEFLHQPRAIASQRLGDSHTPELFDLLLAEAESRALQRVEKTLWSWCPDRNLPAVIAVFKRVKSTVVKLTLKDDCSVEETVIESYFSAAEALTTAENAARAGLHAIGITPKLTLNDKHLLQPEFLFEDLDITFLLLETNPALLNKRDEADHTVLWLAAEAGNADMVRLCLRYNVTVDCADEVGETPLFAACRTGYVDVVQALAEKGANLEHRATGRWTPGFTPLLVAACKGHADIVALLLRRRADVLARDALDRSAVSLAKRHEHRSIYLMLKQAAASQRARPRPPAAARANGSAAGQTSPPDPASPVTFELSDWNLVSEIDGGLKIKRVLLLPDHLTQEAPPKRRGPTLVKFEAPKTSDDDDAAAAATRLQRWWRKRRFAVKCGRDPTQRYIVGPPLSAATDVSEGEDRVTRKPVVIRRLRVRDAADARDLLQRVAALRALCAAPSELNIVRVLDVAQTPMEVWVVTERMDCALPALLKVAKVARDPFPEPLVAFVVAQVLRALEHLHSRGVPYGAVRTSRVLWSRSGAIKLSDPPVTREAPGSLKADVAGVGQLTLDLANLDAASGQAQALTHRGPWSADLHEFVAICLQPSPEDRPSVRALLLHAFVPKAPNRADAAQFFTHLADLL